MSIFTHGDQLGHAFDPRIDAQKYYSARDYMITILRECFLNNCVWLLHKAGESGIGIPAKVNHYLEEKIDADFAAFISQIQLGMLRLVKKNIVIETNLSSNKKIGPMKKYENHPISKFYNEGLSFEHSDRPQIGVSINTDNLEIFSSIENEFAMVELSLEKEKTDEFSCKKKYIPRKVYSWLDTIRQMADEQNFLK